MVGAAEKSIDELYEDIFEAIENSVHTDELIDIFRPGEVGESAPIRKDEAQKKIQACVKELLKNSSLDKPLARNIFIEQWGNHSYFKDIELGNGKKGIEGSIIEAAGAAFDKEYEEFALTEEDEVARFIKNIKKQYFK